MDVESYQNEIEINEKIIVICIGCPGTAKSVLLNAMIGELAFKSGTSEDGGSVTKAIEEYESGKYVYIDTPGMYAGLE